MDRRQFLVAGGVAALGTALSAGSAQGADPSAAVTTAGLLIDTTRCAGCRSCVEACMERNAIPAPAKVNGQPDPETDFRFVKLQRATVDGEKISVRRQCMHCVEPACTSACLTKALYKTDEGPVIWRGEKCMGCRYCMLSCPFDVPKFEYHSANPRVLKCRMCWELIREGKKPACVEACPEEAAVFGRRDQLLQEARRRIHSEPARYVDHVYGEHEAGGTGVLYLAGAAFEKLGFRADLDRRAYPELTREFLYGVPFILGVIPPLLLGISRAADRSKEEQS